MAFAEIVPSPGQRTVAADVVTLAEQVLAGRPDAGVVAVRMASTVARVATVDPDGTTALLEADDQVREIVEAAGVFATAFLRGVPGETCRAIAGVVVDGGALHVFAFRSGELRLALEANGEMLKEPLLIVPADVDVTLH